MIFAYKGAVSSALFDNILKLAEKKIDSFERPRTYRRKVNVIVVEILQNIFHHLELSQEQTAILPTDSVLFVLGRGKKEYYIHSGNYVPLAHVNTLRERIEWVNEMSEKELKQQYREILQNGQFSDKGGAGLGFIDIARKSGSRLEYRFEPGQTEHAFFSLTVKIPF